MAITEANIRRVRRLIGATIPSGGDASNTWMPAADLEEIWDDNSGGLEAAVAECYRTLLSNVLMFNDYTAGQTSEKKSQIREAVAEAVEFWETKVVSANQFRIVGMRSVPPIVKELPDDEPHPDEKNRRHNDNLPQNRRRRY